jgi:hypothetical protein
VHIDGQDEVAQLPRRQVARDRLLWSAEIPFWSITNCSV